MVVVADLGQRLSATLDPLVVRSKGSPDSMLSFVKGQECSSAELWLCPRVMQLPWH